jgi:hypothetical protein
MSCPSNINNLDVDYYQNINGYAVPSSVPYNRNINPNGCRKYKASYPPFAPTINSLSVTSSGVGAYSLVYIYGTNFLPSCYGTTYVNFGPYKQLPITFYSTTSVSFVVPLDAIVGVYNVVVVNIYNNNFGQAINQTYAGNPNFSNPISYQLFGYTINNGTYTITSNAQYNTIIMFTSNSSITFLQNYTVNYIIVGGGGGGGTGEISSSYHISSGGGGGGGLVYGSYIFLPQIYNLVIGSGGLAGSASGINGNPGGSSNINLNSNIIVNANGGSGGQTGISGTGGASGTPGSTGGTGGYANDLQNSPSGNQGTLGGGGGGSYDLGNGGNGSLNISVPIYGTSFGAGGGGGTSDGSAGIGGNSNAGSGGSHGPNNAGNGTANSGGGGGGGAFIDINNTGLGGNGGSGTIILYFNT